MTLFRTISIILLLSFSLNLQGQTTAKEAFTKDIATFMSNTTAGDWDAVLDMTYPKLFTLLPREQMKAAMIAAIEGTGMKTTVKALDVAKVYAPIKEGDETFQRIDYNSELNLGLNDQMWSMRDAMLEGMRASMENAEDVVVNEETKSIVVNQLSTMIAIKADGADEWKYLQFQSNQKSMLMSIIPAAVLDQMFVTKN